MSFGEKLKTEAAAPAPQRARWGRLLWAESVLGGSNTYGLDPDSGPTAPPSVIQGEQVFPHSAELGTGQKPKAPPKDQKKNLDLHKCMKSTGKGIHWKIYTIFLIT